MADESTWSSRIFSSSYICILSHAFTWYATLTAILARLKLACNYGDGWGRRWNSRTSKSICYRRFASLVGTCYQSARINDHIMCYGICLRAHGSAQSCARTRVTSKLDILPSALSWLTLCSLWLRATSCTNMKVNTHAPSRLRFEIPKSTQPLLLSFLVYPRLNHTPRYETNECTTLSLSLLSIQCMVHQARGLKTIVSSMKKGLHNIFVYLKK